MKAVLSVALLGIFASALVCYPYKCRSLEENVCATLSDAEITINKDGCTDSDLVCSVTEAHDYFINVEIDSASFSCIDDGFFDDAEEALEKLEDLDSSEWAKSEICQYDSTKEFASDIPEKDSYKLCTSDEDCLLVDGTEAECACGLKGTGFCVPEWGSSFFSEWYDICKDKEANVIYYKYFLFKSNYLGFILDVDDSEDYECISDSTFEGNLWDDAVSDYEDQKEEDEDKDKDDDDDDDGAIHLILGSLVGLLLLA